MTHAQWLWLHDGLLLLLFGLAWAGGASMKHDAAPAMRGLALFNVLVGIGLGLIGLRGQWPYFATHGLPNLLQLTGYVALWRAGQTLANGRPGNGAEQAALWGIGTLLVLWFGRSPEWGPQRMAANLSVLAWVSLRGAWQGFWRLRDRQMPGAAVALAAASGLTGLALLWRIGATLTTGARAEFDNDQPSTLALAYLLGAAIFIVNTVFAYVVFGRVLDELRRISRHDGLTGLLNRGALNDALREAWARHRRGGRPLALLCLDIDHFKAINDGHGHAAGDAVLTAFAARLRDQLRQIDTVGRIGGEEFVALLPDADARSAREVAERLRQGVADSDGLHPDRACRVTVSVGVACATPGDGGPEALLARADAALYRAKATGRNRVCGEEAPAKVLPFPERPRA